MTGMGDTIGLDYGAVLNTIGVYAAKDEVKKTFERVLECFFLERKCKQ